MSRERQYLFLATLYGCVSAVVSAALLFFAFASPPPLRALHTISLPMDVQIDASILARPKAPGELRVAFMSNCFFHGAVRNGQRIAVLPDSLTMVRRFEEWLGTQEGFDKVNLLVFNASVDGTSILDHIALTAKMAEYGIDAIIIAMAYTEFRKLPLHPLLGNLERHLEETGIDLEDTADLSNSRGRVISTDFQRWLTAQKYEFYKISPLVERFALWNREVRDRLAPTRDESYYKELFGGEAISVRHIGLGSGIEQTHKPYLQTFLNFTARRGIHVVLVNQPVRFKSVIEDANPGLFAAHADLLRTAAKEYDHCSFVDMDGRLQVDRYLSDYIHLTYDGTRAVSTMLNPALRDILIKLKASKGPGFSLQNGGSVSTLPAGS